MTLGVSKPILHLLLEILKLAWEKKIPYSVDVSKAVVEALGGIASSFGWARRRILGQFYREAYNSATLLEFPNGPLPLPFRQLVEALLISPVPQKEEDSFVSNRRSVESFFRKFWLLGRFHQTPISHHDQRRLGHTQIRNSGKLLFF
jgi:hypothetical protein